MRSGDVPSEPDLDSRVDQLATRLQCRLGPVPGLFKVLELRLQSGLVLRVRPSLATPPAGLQSLRVRDCVSNQRLQHALGRGGEPMTPSRSEVQLRGGEGWF